MFYEIVFAESHILRAGYGSRVLKHSSSSLRKRASLVCQGSVSPDEMSFLLIIKRSSLGQPAVLQGCWSPYVALNEYFWTWQIKIWSHGVFLFFALLWCSNLCGIPVEKQVRVDQTTCSWPGVACLCPRSLVSHEPDRHHSQETATGCPWPPPLSPHLRESYRHSGTESLLYQWFSMDIAYAQWSGKVLYSKHI